MATPPNQRIERSRRTILDALNQSFPATRQELSRRTGLAPSTVAGIVRGLLAEGLVREHAADGQTGRGRPSSRLSPRRPPGHLVGIDFGHTHIAAALATTTQEIVAEARMRLDVEASAGNALDQAAVLVADLLDRTGVPAGSVLRTAAGIPGPVNQATGRIQSATILAGWTGVRPRQELTARLGGEVLIANDAELAALAEHTHGTGRNASDLIYVKASHGIGAGLILAGRRYTGAYGASGEIGHTLIQEGGAQCRCGQRGCLESVVSIGEVWRQLVAAGLPLPERTEWPDDLSLAALAGNPVAARIITDAGRRIGRVLSDLCNALDPAMLIIGGELATAGDALLEGIRESLRRFAQPAISDRVQVRTSSLGPRAGLIGALTLAATESAA
ncbi:ROK family transcriptional regulator [Actinoallomurus iriomotensis]|uniref:Transcriptional regulator n=1 Tax=Actinoallomurus iriomotensis TaxID=478107 RepID=A0A9W6RRT3_9ACTN|nr:ROK family transcriptional regulator [Actinoallomurus iriomotensis]GLY80659.1 transcriptional regulator [Actinoallomurus iriomotensis]